MQLPNSSPNHFPIDQVSISHSKNSWGTQSQRRVWSHRRPAKMLDRERGIPEMWIVDIFSIPRTMWQWPAPMWRPDAVSFKGFSTLAFSFMLNESGLAKLEEGKPPPWKWPGKEPFCKGCHSGVWALLSSLQIVRWPQPCTEISNDTEPVF